ncbi:MAG: DUF89 family protein [Candidatus Margulisbacteria bacterium]|nr:DUF89 family protein [Candidatus Margulisiibacteriota bacterium]
MKAFLECVPCVLNQVVEVIQRQALSLDRKESILKSVMAELQKQPISKLSPPELTQQAHKILHKFIAKEDFYKEIKEQTNREALELFPRLEKIVKNAKDPLLTSMKLAIAGNVIDYGPAHRMDVMQTIDRVLKAELKSDHYKKFIKSLRNAKKVLYVADNAGEIVFDKLLIQQLLDRGIAVVVAVKSKPILNDVTMPDAKAAGLDQMGVNIIKSGSETAGTMFEDTASEFKKIFNEADLVIAKGQGNFETLKRDPGVFFLLMVKCPHLALASGLKAGDMVLWNKAAK